MKQCKCESCKISRGIGRLQKKYKITDKDMAPIETLWNTVEERSNEFGMLCYTLEEMGLADKVAKYRFGGMNGNKQGAN